MFRSFKLVNLLKKSKLVQFFIIQTIFTIVFFVLLNNLKPEVVYKFEYENQTFNVINNNQNFDGLLFADNITGFSALIVPNIVHYIMFDKTDITFAQFISILSVLKNQKPDIIYFHCNFQQISGQYFQRVLEKAVSTNTAIRVRRIVKPEVIFGNTISEDWRNWHGSDITRIRVLREFGGIYIDNDVYVVQSLDVFRKFEMTLNWDEGLMLGNQVLVAHRNARFLKRWLDTYRAYDENKWYFNGGELPTKAVLYKTPELVHRLKGEFGVDAPNVCPKIFKYYHKNWRKDYYTVHLVMRGSSVSHVHWCFGDDPPKVLTFDENNIQYMNITFAEMCRDVLS